MQYSIEEFCLQNCLISLRKNWCWIQRNFHTLTGVPRGQIFPQIWAGAGYEEIPVRAAEPNMQIFPHIWAGARHGEISVRVAEPNVPKFRHV
jgi:hypothetical protein